MVTRRQHGFQGYSTHSLQEYLCLSLGGSGMGSALKHTPTSGQNAPMATRFVGWVRVGGSPDVSCNVSESLLRFTHLYYLLLLASGPLSRLTLALNGIVLQRLLVAMASRLTKELSAPPCVLLSLSHCATHNWAPLSLVLMRRRWRWFSLSALLCEPSSAAPSRSS